VNTLLTTLAGQFARPLLLAGVLPVIITVSLLLLVTYPRFPFPLSPPAALRTVDASWQVTWASLLVVVAGMVLQVMNTPILRLMSGYPWRRTVIGKAMTLRKREEFVRLRTRRDGLVTLYQDLLPEREAPLDVRTAEEAAADTVNRELTPLSVRLNDDFPYEERLILPTRLGNVIRNSEDYSRELYGASTVRLWPRLVAVIDTRYATLIDDAKTNLDFMVNCAVLFVVAAALTAIAASQTRVSGWALADATTRALFFVALSTLAYAAAVERARSWGGMVKAAVDLYRRALLKQLEYTYTFLDVRDERKRFWERVSALWAFPDMRDVLEDLPFVAAAPTPAVTAASSANNIPLTIARGVTPPTGKPYATTTVTLRIQNIGGEAAKKVTASDPIPPAWTFVWGSLARPGSAAPPELKRSVPMLEFEVESIAKGASCEISYQLQSLVMSA
jgi:uncharacterized repeat protein (TIGR01451 family)